MHSILFKIGPIPIRAYGLMLWLGLVIGLLRTMRAARRTGVQPNHVVDIALYSVLAGVVTAHLASILLDLPLYLKNPSEIASLWGGILSTDGGLRGLSFHGGLIGGVGMAYLYSRRHGLRFLEIVDLFSPGLAIGYAFTRIGCFLNGCCYGVPTSLPVGVSFHLHSGYFTPPSHPTQLYSAAASLLIFWALTRVERVRRYKGQVFLSYLGMYGVYRFLVEFLRRGVTAEVSLLGLTQAQWVSLVMIAVSVALLWRYRPDKK